MVADPRRQPDQLPADAAHRLADRDADPLLRAARSRSCSAPPSVPAARRTCSTGRSRSTSGSTTSRASTPSRRTSSARSTSSSRTRRSAPRWAAPRGAACCSRARPAPARRTWPRRWPARPACRSCSCRPRRSSRCTTARPPARSARTSRRCARRPAQEGGAIGFIEEIDAIAMTRGGLSARRRCPSAARMTSLDCGGLTGLPSAFAGASWAATVGADRSIIVRGRRRRRQRAARADAVLRRADRLAEAAEQARRPRQPLPARRTGSSSGRSRRRRTCCSSRRPTGPTTSTRPCCGPGRFDRRLTFELPGQGRPARADRPLPGQQGARRRARRRRARDALAGVTQGYTPVMIEHLLRRGAGQRRAARRAGDELARTSRRPG